MQELGLKTDLLTATLIGQKTIEARLGKPKYLKIRVGDELSLREDTWKDGGIVSSAPNKGTIKITQVLYFESFEEMFEGLSYKAFIPMAASKSDAVKAYRQFYSTEDEYEYGVVAFLFTLM